MVHFHFTLSLRDGPSIVKLDFYFPQYAMWMNSRVRAIGLCLEGPLVGVHVVFYDISLIWGGLDPRALGFRVELDIHTYTRRSNYTCPLSGYQRVLLARIIICPCPVYGIAGYGGERERERDPPWERKAKSLTTDALHDCAIATIILPQSVGPTSSSSPPFIQVFPPCFHWTSRCISNHQPSISVLTFSLHHRLWVGVIIQSILRLM